MTNIIIPTYNAENQIGELIEALKSQTIRCDITVIDSSSADNTVKIAEDRGIKTVKIRKKEFDHGATRSTAGRLTDSEILIYLSQDAMPVNKYSIENLLRPFEDKDIGAVFGRQVPHHDAKPFGAHSRLFNYPENSYIRSFADRHIYRIKTPFLSNSFAAYKKKALDEVGSFKRSLILGEDSYAGAKLLLSGYKIAYAADAVVFHSHNYTVFQEFQRYFDIGVFHKKEKWILEEFGKPEVEGIKYIKSEIVFLIKNRKYYLLPEFFTRNCLKYTGYKLGKNYEKIPMSIVKKASMHKDWWNKIF